MSDNIITSKQDANQVLRLAFDDATQALRTTGSAATTVTVIQPDGALLHTTVDSSALPDGAATETEQQNQSDLLAQIRDATTQTLDVLEQVQAGVDTFHVDVDSSVLPIGAATEAKQDVANTSLDNIVTSSGEISTNTLNTALGITTANTTLNSIDSKLTSPLAVTGPLTDTQLRATPVPVSGTVSTGGLTDTQLRASPVPVSVSGVATAANQTTANASLSSIDSKLTSPLTVTGPLTDTQLRATPVPVSGSVSTGGLTDTQLRATAVPVSLTSTTITGSVAVTGPLTDTQLRATPVPVSGTVSTGGLTDTQLRATPVPVSGTVTANAGTNLNTSALNLETTQSAISAKLPATLGQKASAASLAVTLASDQTSIPVAATLSAETTKVIGTVNISAGQTIATTQGAKTVVQLPTYTIYTSTPVTTASYVQVVASTAAAVTRVSIFDSSGQALILATGAAASEVIKLYVPPGGGEYDLAIPSGTRVSIKALTATANSGYQLINFLT